MMKKSFENPVLEVVRFGGSDIVRTSECCDIAGIPMDDDDEVCGKGDAECACSADQSVNCVTPGQ